MADKTETTPANDSGPPQPCGCVLEQAELMESRI
jgi:hypothetical protein